MSIESLMEKINSLAVPFLEELNAEIVDLHIHRHRSSVTIQILADRPFGGITILECAQLNRKIGDAIEAQNLFQEHYVLEVSSPGIDRPLRTPKDFLRVTGREVHFFLSEPIDGKLEQAGIIKRIETDHVIIDSDSVEIMIPRNKITKAVQIIKH